MASTRKSRSVNKRFLYTTEISPVKDGDSTSRSNKRKRKVSDMLGPQWSKEELQRFYEAYRKHGKDWKKVAASIRNRSVEMVEALYTMNRAYLSLPEGTASVVGLIAMMTDHYSVLEGSDSEQESNDGIGISRKPNKRGRGKPQSNTAKGSDRHFSDVSHSQTVASSYGCLSLLKKKRSGGGIQPRAVGKRTPRIPVRYTYDKDNIGRVISSSKQGARSKLGADDDDVAHEVALVLAEASHRAGSPQVSQTHKKREVAAASPVGLGERMCSESEMTSAKNIGNEYDVCEGSLGSTEGDTNFVGERPRFAGRRTSSTLVQQKSRKCHGKKLDAEDVGHHDLDDIKEACSGTEGQKLCSFDKNPGDEVADVTFIRSPGQTSKKRSKKVLFGRDEDDALDALQTLADLSLMMPSAMAEAESTVPLKEGKESNIDNSRTRDIISTSQQKVKPKPSPSKRKADHSVLNNQVSETRNFKPGKVLAFDSSPTSEIKVTGARRRKPKSSVSKISTSEAQMKFDSSIILKKEFLDQGKKSVNRIRGSAHESQQQYGKLVQVSEHSFSSTDIRRDGEDTAVSSVLGPTTNKIKSPAKSKSRRKLDKSQVHRNFSDMNLSDTLVKNQSNISGQLYHEKKTLDLKERISNCLSSYRVRRWCVCEWFYSSIDYPWFAKSEFVEYLYHVGLGHVPRLTRIEWDVIRSSLGKPRRFSKQFLMEEKEKLNHYRESVRNHYTELRMGKREGLPTDLARPLAVGQHVIAIHPRSREVHNGSVLTVDHNRCRVQFHRPELGVEFVKDIDCMPLDPMENMPTSLKRQNITVDKFYDALKHLKVSERAEDRTKEEFIKFAPSKKVETADGPPDVASAYIMNNMSKPVKEGFVSPNALVKVGHNEPASPQLQSAFSQIQAKEADIHALAELTRALDKKNALVIELRRMNDDVSEDSSLKDVDSFTKQYAAVIVQLNEVTEEVSSALKCLRQRNTYQANCPLLWQKQMATLDDRVNLNNLNHVPSDSQETGSHVYDVVETSRVRAQKMVDAAIQAVASLKEGGGSVQKTEEAIDYVNNRLSVGHSTLPVLAGQVNGNLAHQNQLNYCTSNQMASDQAVGSKSNGETVECEPGIPTGLISNCVATLLMIQKCADHQFPPSDAAQILEFAVTSLQPCSPHNIPVYSEIQKCMGIIRSQMLARIPT